MNEFTNAKTKIANRLAFQFGNPIAVACVLLSSLSLILPQSSFAQTPSISSLEAMVYEAESVLICTFDEMTLWPKQGAAGHAVLTVNPIEVLKGKVAHGNQCEVWVRDDDDAKRIKQWVDDKKEFLVALRRYGKTLGVQNQQYFFHGSSRDSKSKPFSYWYDFKQKKSASMAEAIQDVRAFLETEKLDPAKGINSISRPGHLQVYFPVNKKMDQFAQRALRLQLTAEEIEQTSGVTEGPIQMASMNSFDSSDKKREVEWLAVSAVHNLAKSKQNIELLKSLMVKSPIEFGEVNYRDEGDKITVFRRYQVRSDIQLALKNMGVDVELPPMDETVWTRPKHPDEVALLKTLEPRAEVYFELDPFNPPKKFARVKKMILRGSTLTSAPDLSGFETLEMLQFEHTKVADISELSKLRKLKYLKIAWAPVTDLSPLKGLEDLKELSLQGTRVADLAPLSKLSKLEVLVLTQTPVVDLSPLMGLQNLKMLYAGPEKLDLQPLRELKDLQHWFGR